MQEEEEEEVIEHSQLTVTVAIPERGSPNAIEIDLKKLRRRGTQRSRAAQRIAGEPGERMVTGAGGYASLRFKWEGCYRSLRKNGRGREAQRFGSRRLGAGDHFAVTLIRPGRYSVTNVHNGTQGEIAVAYQRSVASPTGPPDQYTSTAPETDLTGQDRASTRPRTGVSL